MLHPSLTFIPRKRLRRSSAGGCTLEYTSFVWHCRLVCLVTWGASSDMKVVVVEMR